jgi:murein L,D-transpeptidase YcbB/YkuD
MKFLRIAVVLFLSLGGILVLSPAASAAASSCASTHRYWNTTGTTYADVPAITSGGSINCVLGVGNQGAGVKALQKSIKYCYNSSIVVDGDYGPATKSAVIAIQKSLGLTQDGVYGPQTRSAMNWIYIQERTGTPFTCGTVYTG